MKTGVIYLKVRLELEYDLDEDEVQELIQELDYEFKDAKNRIQNTQIKEFETGIPKDMIDA